MAYNLKMSSIPITVVELSLFLRQAESIWDEVERQEFVDFIARNPETGDVIPDTGGVRKVRWRRQGTGKRGGARVIYFYRDARMPLFLILIYAKARRENMTADEKKQVRVLATALKQSYGRRK
mgnify:CR=1 FL=1